MADRPRRECKVPERLYHAPSFPIRRKKANKVEKRDKTLYEVEIKEVDTERRRIKIHFKGYSDAYDEWRPYDDQTVPLIRKEHVFIPSSASVNDRKELFHDRLYREIKRKLYSGRKEDPNVRIELSVEEDIFYTGVATVACRVVGCNREIYPLDNNRKLDCCLGVKWDERIQNDNGDYACVVPGTVKFWLLKKAPIIEYKLIGQKYIRSEVEDAFHMIFTFIRRDGNRQDYTDCQ